MQITNDSVATMAYSIHTEKPDGELIEFFDKTTPKEMIFGYNQHVDGFEKKLKGRKNGDFSFEITPKEAFGDYQEALNIWVPKSSFLDQGELRSDLLFLGNKVNMLDRHGNKITGTVKNIDDENVLMDFNHPLAGKKLFVSGEILSVRPLSQRDLEKMQLTHEGCGCGSSGCGCQDNHNQQDASCCSSESEHEDDCEVCGNPPEKMGYGYGNCQCGV